MASVQASSSLLQVAIVRLLSAGCGNHAHACACRALPASINDHPCLLYTSLLGLAVEKLSAAGYVYIGMDHFALPSDDLAQAQQRGGLHRNFMGYTTHAETCLLYTSRCV